MPALLVLAIIFGSIWALLAGGGSVDNARLEQERHADRIFKGVSAAHSHLQKNYAMTGRYEGAVAWPATAESGSNSKVSGYYEHWVEFGNITGEAASSATLRGPSRGSVAVIPSATAGGGYFQPDQSTSNIGEKNSSGDWPGLAAAVWCTANKATEGTDSAAFTQCTSANSARGHRYLAVLVPIAYSTAYSGGTQGWPGSERFSCWISEAEGGQAQSRQLWELLARKRESWSKRLGTDVWLRGYASTDMTPNGWQGSACPQLWIYLGKNSI